MTDETAHSASRLQRVLAYTIAGLVILSLIAIITLIAGYGLGAAAAQGTGQGIWPTVFFVPLIGLPIAFVLMIVLLAISLTGRSRQNRETDQ